MMEQSSPETPDANRANATRRSATIATSEWNYCSVSALREALDARKLSALELVEHTIARIEALDAHQRRRRSRLRAGVRGGSGGRR